MPPKAAREPAADRECTARELQQELGVCKQRFYALTRMPGFPAPVGWRDRGRTWSLAAVMRWRRERASRVGQQRRDRSTP